jgi:arylsulfatase A-like enzyme
MKTRCLICVCLLAGFHAAAVPSTRPNIVFILADDLGFEALGCYGGVTYKGLGAVRTPNLDALAKNGMRFTSCFSTPVCSPARSELLTGKYNFRTGFTDIAGRNGATESLDPKAHPTLAAQLKASGYVTAVAGKWHLGPPVSMKEVPTTAESDTDYPHPRACGFERQCILGGAHLELYGEPKAGLYTPDILNRWVMRFIESRKGKAEPFFLYYPSPIPHKPLHPTPLNAEGQRADKKNYPYLVEYLDRQVGEVVRKLSELGLSENTLVLFSGDNGTDRTIATEMENGKSIPGGKGTLLDTGSHVPLLASWPGIIKPGAVNGNLVDFTDVVPTCLELAGVPPLSGIDGVSFARQLQGKSAKPREWVHSLQLDKYFVRDACWKLRENGALYDVSKSPYDETLITPESTTPESKAAREQLGDVMRRLHPQKP